MFSPLRIGFVSISLLLVACAQGGGSGATLSAPTAAATPGASAAATAGASGASGASDVDRAFIDMMVPHHESAIAMAQIALERSERQELIALANDIISAQQEEIAQLKGWRLEWFGSDETPSMDAMPLMPGVNMPGMGGMDGQTMDMSKDVEMLRTAEPFDLEFMQAMIAHHQMAIEAGGIVSAETQVGELRTLADGMVTSQTAEIQEMEAWIAEWYPDASPAM